MSWLWKGDSTSPAQFEKALSKLAIQITSANVALETSRSRGRRIKALWTLYTLLTYLLYTLIITLVLGPQRWAIPHYAGLIGGPLLIYGIRKVIEAFYNWRIKRQQTYLDHLQKQRDGKIADLKKATRYDSTQELLQKYGGAPTPKATPVKQSPSQQQSGSKVKKGLLPDVSQQRTGLPPPPTANIPGRNRVNTSPTTPPRQQPFSPTISSSPLTSSRAQASPQSPGAISPDEPGFAPNAFSEPPPYSPGAGHIPAIATSSHHWYDRILDVLLGEDETAAKNRLALLCQNCRLVNGLAPPGTKTLEQVGRWRCSSCGTMNGVENEGVKVVKEMVEKAKIAEKTEKDNNAADPAERKNDHHPDSPMIQDVSENEETKASKTPRSKSKSAKTYSTGAEIKTSDADDSIETNPSSSGDEEGRDEKDTEKADHTNNRVTKRVTRSAAAGRKGSPDSST